MLLCICVSFVYKLEIVYNDMRIKYAYYGMSGVLHLFLIVKYYPRASELFRSSNWRVYLLLIFMLMWLLFSSLFHGTFNIVLSLLSVLNIMTYAVVFPYLLYLNPALWDKLQNLLFLGVVLCLLSPLMPNMEVMEPCGRFQGPFAGTAIATAFLLISAVFLFPENKRDIRWCILPVMIVLQLLTKTRSTLAATLLIVVSMFYYFVKSGRYYYSRMAGALLIVFGIGLLCVLLWLDPQLSRTREFLRFTENPAVVGRQYRGDQITRYVPGLQGSWLEQIFADRLHHWALGMDRIVERPWLGYGLGFVFTGSATDSLEETGYYNLLQPHSLFISSAQIGGIPLLAMVLVIYGTLAYLSLRTWRHCRDLSALQAKALTFIAACLLLSIVGLEWFMSASIADKFWWLAVGYICMDKRICSGRYSPVPNTRCSSFSKTKSVSPPINTRILR